MLADMPHGIFKEDPLFVGADGPRKGLNNGEIAYLRLRHLIVSLELEPGSQVDELSLSKRLDIGRTPIREALLRLSQDNLVTIIPRKGTIIAPINVAELREVEELRWETEALAARWAAERATEEDRQDLEALIASAQAGGFNDIDHWDVEVDRQFHLRLAKAAKNRYLVSTIDRLYNHSVRLFYLSQAAMAEAAEEMQDYNRILNAVHAGDPDGAQDRMRDHLMDSRQRMSRAFSSTFVSTPARRKGV